MLCYVMLCYVMLCQAYYSYRSVLCGYYIIIYIYIYIFYASRLAFGDDGKYVYNTRLAWLLGTMYETPKVIFEKMLEIEKLTGGFNPPNPRRLNHWTMYMLQAYQAYSYRSVLCGYYIIIFYASRLVYGDNGKLCI